MSMQDLNEANINLATARSDVNRLTNDNAKLKKDLADSEATLKDIHSLHQEEIKIVIKAEEEKLNGSIYFLSLYLKNLLFF